MKIKTSLFLLTAFLIVISLGLVSAFTISPGSISLSQGTNSTYFTIHNTNTTSDIIVNVGSFSAINDSDGHTLTIITQPMGFVTIANGSSLRVNVSYTGDSSNINYGTYSSVLNVSSGTESSLVTLNFNSGYCSAGEQIPSGIGLDLDIDYDVTNGFGDEDEWYPLDEVEVTVNVDNTGDDDLEDLVLTWCLYDSDDETCVLEEEADTFDLDEGDDIDVTFTIDVDPDELNPDNEDYKLIVKVFGDNSDYREEDLCLFDDTGKIIITIEKDFVILNKINVPDSIPCGEIVEISGKVWNIGTKDQNDAYALIYNKELGILNQRIELGDIDSFKSKNFNAEIKIPINTTEKTYTLYFSVYDDNDDVYETDGEDSFSSVQLKVEGCRQSSALTIGAELSDETPRAIIGRQTVILATLKNTGTSQVTYTLSVSGNTAWSEVADIDPRTVTLNAGESKTVSIYLDIAKDASVGDEEFTIKATSGSTIVEQKVSLRLEKGFSTTGIVDNIRDNWFLYTIVLVNIILIIAIIVVVVSLVRSGK